MGKSEKYALVKVIMVNETIKDAGEFYSDKKDFTSLEARKKWREVKLFFYQKILPMLPKNEIYNLELQIRKAPISITADIAEGYGRYYYQEGIQFYRIARSSIERSYY